MGEHDFLDHIKRNEGLVFKLVLLYAADEEEKKDLYQEIMYQAWKGWPGFKGESKFSTWLYRVALNTIFTQKRKKSVIDLSDKIEQLSPTVAAHHHQNEDIQMLRKAIRMLKETDRAIIALHLDGYGNDEVGQILGITANYANVKLHRIKQQLSDILKKI